MDIYTIASSSLSRVGYCRGIPSFVTHIDWSQDGKYLQVGLSVCLSVCLSVIPSSVTHIDILLVSGEGLINFWYHVHVCLSLTFTSCTQTVWNGVPRTLNSTHSRHSPVRGVQVQSARAEEMVFQPTMVSCIVYCPHTVSELRRTPPVVIVSPGVPETHSFIHRDESKPLVHSHLL